ncbi:MAG: endolytic transglycosylase MltG [Deltaproteobacteria bacterium]|nr:endolytic transglycosylase MltG [Deltaproteobacteria bacterium]
MEVKHLSRKNLVFASIALGFLITVFLSLGLGLFLITPANKAGKEQVFVIQTGHSLREIAEDLENKELVRSKTLFVLWARIKGYSKRIRSGEYLLNSAMGPAEILEKIRLGKVLTYSVTIPEGATRHQIADLLHENELAHRNIFLSLTEDPEILKKHNIFGLSLEGYLFPDTYQFERGISPSLIIETMVRRFRQMTDPLKAQAREAGMSMEEILILASIVEKETGRPDERALIASVFLNRLKLGMRLQSDPTVIYGMERFDGKLRKKDLMEKTPYNTYVIRGLTPGPICNPGLESIKAVIFPATTDYLYFVSKNDGSHQFSTTLSEHNCAVDKYQK